VEKKIQKKWNKPKNLLIFFSEQGTAKRNHPTTTQVVKTPPTTTNRNASCAKRWSSVTVQREMEFVVFDCAICGQRKKKE